VQAVVKKKETAVEKEKEKEKKEKKEKEKETRRVCIPLYLN
jgi:hypothetical protein